MEQSQILKSAGIPHVCDPTDIDERELKDRMAKQGAVVETTTASLAQAKAEEVQKRLVQALVISAVAVHHGEECIWRYLETASLAMREFSDVFLERYIDDAGPGILESVGTFRLEQTGAQLFTRIEGDYFTVLGLPLLPLLGFLRHAGALGE